MGQIHVARYSLWKASVRQTTRCAPLSLAGSFDGLVWINKILHSENTHGWTVFLCLIRVMAARGHLSCLLLVFKWGITVAWARMPASMQHTNSSSNSPGELHSSLESLVFPALHDREVELRWFSDRPSSWSRCRREWDSYHRDNSAMLRARGEFCAERMNELTGEIKWVNSG